LNKDKKCNYITILRHLRTIPLPSQRPPRQLLPPWLPPFLLFWR